MLPKTLFGERYVDLEAPAAPVDGDLHDGALIDQDRSSAAIELERVLDDLLPLLQAIQPDKLAATLGALATALQGRGEQLGNDLASARPLPDRARPADADAASRPQRSSPRCSTSYDGAAARPAGRAAQRHRHRDDDRDQRNQLAAFLADTTDLGDSTRTFLDNYGDRIIQRRHGQRAGARAAGGLLPGVPVPARGPGHRCSRGSSRSSPAARCTSPWRSTRDNGRYQPVATTRSYGAHSGPNCRGLPHPVVPAPAVPVERRLRLRREPLPAPLP